MQQLIRNKLSLYWIIVFALSLGSFGLLLPEVLHADEEIAAAVPTALINEAQSDDLACRICHEETDKELTFPSGEPLPLCWTDGHYREHVAA